MNVQVSSEKLVNPWPLDTTLTPETQEYVIGRALTLVAQMDTYTETGTPEDFTIARWAGSACEILRELTRSRATQNA